MNRNTEADNEILEEFRVYLEALPPIHMNPRLRNKIVLSDVIQETLVQAWLRLDRIRRLDAEGRKRWLRWKRKKIGLDHINYWHAMRRDVRQERPLGDAAAESWCGLLKDMIAQDSSPSERLAEQEKALRLVEALSQLDMLERKALILQQYRAWTLAQIAEHLGCTKGAVAGLHARGREKLRKYLSDAPRDKDAVNQTLEEYRAYLETLTFIRIDPRLRSKFDPSDIVQETLLEAWSDLERIQALDAEGRRRWLRHRLECNLRDRTRLCGVGQERSLEDAAASARRLPSWLVAEEDSPGERLAEQENALRLVEALSQLGVRQREALILKIYHGWTMAQIAEHLGCTSSAVAGLYARGLMALRKALAETD
jgi:RNA polymerase sigma-70 factor (ECF subfamily)